MRSVIVCILLPRFELVVAARRREGLMGEPVALAPEAGGVQAIGEVSPAAEAFGVRAGMRLGEALARCPQLAVLPPDPIAVARTWERVLERLEGTGAAVEPARPGEACFDARGLCRLHGGHLDGVLTEVRRALARGGSAGAAPPHPEGAPSRAGAGARLGVGPVRFCAIAAAHAARARRHAVVDGTADLAPLPVALLARRAQTVALPQALERLGVATLGDLATLPRAAVGDRFGRAGLLAHDLACGHDTPLRPRTPSETLEEELELPEAAGGQQLEHALGLLIDRLLARRERGERTLRSAVLCARLVAGGTWRERVVFREATADAARIRLAAAARLALLPAPAQALSLAADRLGPPHAHGDALFEDGAARRDARLREAVRQARAVAGPHAALRVLVVDPDSRVPERHAVLTPFER
jgi:protein ImuB